MPVDAPNSSAHRKPRMLYFQARTDNYSPLNFEGTIDRPLKALRESFDIVLIGNDCDFNEVCDQHEPDIAMFDCGDGALKSRLEIRNAGGTSGILKIGFMKGDAWSASRIKLLYEIEEWGLEVVFEQGDLALKEYLPQIGEMIFYWPLFIDTDLYRDYQTFKTIPFLVLGQTDVSAYAWRGRIKRAIEASIPSLVFPHPGYHKRFSDAFVIFREAYARTINSSLFALGGGAFNQQMLKKNLEIPACRACLVTDKTPANELFGFEDMVNCVFADEKDVSDKIGYLGSHRDELEKITDSGYALVHGRHSFRHRKQILQWFTLRNKLAPGQRIIQQDLLGDLHIEGEDSNEESISISLGGRDRSLLQEGDRLLARGNYEQAAAQFAEAAHFTGYIPDADIRFALCMLHLGHPFPAIELILKQFALARRLEIPEPDAVEWAVFLLGLACQGKLKDALRFARYFPSISHKVLDQTRWIVSVLAMDDEMEMFWADRALSACSGKRPSIHSLPSSYLEGYIANARAMLGACGRTDLASSVPDLRAKGSPSHGDEGLRSVQLEGLQIDKPKAAGYTGGITDAIQTIEDLIARQTALGTIKSSLKRVLPQRARTRIKGRISSAFNRIGTWMITLGKRFGSE